MLCMKMLRLMSPIGWPFSTTGRPIMSGLASKMAKTSLFGLAGVTDSQGSISPSV